MRVIGGKWRGRSLTTPDGQSIRPTGDRVREAIFNIVEHGRHTKGGGSPIPDAVVLDGFAGTGAMGIEALSRGAAKAYFLEKDRASISVMEKNLADCGAAATIRKADCLAPPAAPEACDLIFLDPPYGQGMAVPALIALTDAGWMGGNALCMVEIGKGDGFETPDGFEMLDERRYGAARAILLTRRAQTASAG